jgi:4-aminobutyrate aminotransferase-like enzyme
MVRGIRSREMNTDSELLFEKSKKKIPGGVNSPVRAYKAVGRNPIFIEKGKGSHIFDVDGNEYIDYVCSWGPGILGHANGQLGNGSRYERNTCCQRIHRQGLHYKISWLLSWTFRRIAGKGRFRCIDTVGAG